MNPPVSLQVCATNSASRAGVCAIASPLIHFAAAAPIAAMVMSGGRWAA
ncbi:hypothetical protein [Sphingomonas nostoxanthinifaciens]|nr:hypothetical protein [Sphingomonas nostoxanthinifaciens]